MKLKSLDFRERRKQSWDRMESLLKEIDKKGIASLSPLEILELGKLYRTACSSLYVARNISLDKNLHEYLEGLVSKGYLTIYCSKIAKENPIRDFILHDFPELVRKYKWYHLVSLLCLLAGIFSGFFATLQDSSNYFLFLQRGETRNPYSSKQVLAEALQSGRNIKIDQKSYFAGFLFTHNTKVGILCFVLGVILGLPTIYLLIYNGGTLGAMSYVYHINDLAVPWWAWILPHGITELLAVVLCGGCGLMLAMSLIVPGPYGRKHRLKTTGRDAGLIMIGTVGMFFIAAIIEGYFRQSSLPDFPRYVVALITLLLWIYYFGWRTYPKNSSENREALHLTRRGF